MLSWLYELLVTLVRFVLSLVGIDWNTVGPTLGIPDTLPSTEMSPPQVPPPQEAPQPVTSSE